MTAVPTFAGTDRRADYVSAVAVELGDLAPDDRAELIEELDDHIAALLEDRPDVDLVAELGTPRAYAVELRTAAGLTSSGTPRTGLRDVAALVRSRVTVSLPWLPGFLHTLKPAWWVLRGGVLAYVVDDVAGSDWRSAQGVLVLVLGVVASLWVAQHPPRTRPWQRVVIGLDVVAALAVLQVAWFGQLSQTDYGYETQYVNSCPTALDNIYAYDAAGNPLTDVRLYDQDGAPFDLSVVGCNYDADYAPSGAPNVYPWPSAVTQAEPEQTGPPASLTPLPGATVSPSVTPTVTPSVTPTVTPSVTPTVTPAVTPSVTVTPSTTATR